MLHRIFFVGKGGGQEFVTDPETIATFIRIEKVMNNLDSETYTDIVEKVGAELFDDSHRMELYDMAFWATAEIGLPLDEVELWFCLIPEDDE